MSKLSLSLKKALHGAEIAIVCILCFSLMLDIGNVFSNSFIIGAVYSLFFISSFTIVYFFRNQIFSGSITKRILFTVSIAIFIRSIVIYFLALQPQGDYAVYLSTAMKIKNGVLNNTSYYGIFPHALNYPIFISFFYRLFGEATWLPRVINLIFGALEVGFGTYILEKCVDSKTGLIGGLAIALNPSVIIFTLLSGGEPIYSSIIIIAVFFLLLTTKGKNPWICVVAAGTICAIANFFRPTGIILIIASILIIFLYSADSIKKKIIQSLLLLSSFAVIVWATGFITSSVSGYKKPSYSFGWNLYIGANEQSQGTWNEKDAELFTEMSNNSDDPSEIQKYFLDLGVERYKNMGINIISHFKNKLGVWFDESYILRVITNWQTDETRFKSTDLQQTYSLLINLYNLLIVLGAIAALLLLSFEKKAPLILKMIAFYMIGSIMLFMVVETATRYKGAYYSVLTILAIYGYWRIFHYMKEHTVK